MCELVISISGVDQMKKDFLANCMKDLNVQCDNDLSYKVNLLVCESVMTLKYAAAFLREIPIVNSNWCIQCQQSKQIIKNYEFFRLQMFQGMRAIVLGFQPIEYAQIQEYISKNGGTCSNNINSALNEKDFNIAIVKQDKLSDFLSFIQSIGVENNIVSENWIKQIYSRKTFIPPEKYQLIPKQNGPLSLSEDKDNDLQILNNTLIYIDLDDQSQKDMQKLMVSLMGGMFVPFLKPIVTHIISRKKHDNCGAAYQVNQQWLIDCLTYKKKMVEEDYQIVDIERNGLAQIMQNLKDTKQNSFNFGRSNEQASQNISFGIANKPNGIKFDSQAIQQSSQVKVGAGLLFSDCLFIFERKHQEILKIYKEKIKQNSGSYVAMDQYLQTREKNKKKLIFYILGDDRDNKARLETKKIPEATYVNHRWIDHCIEKKHVETNLTQQTLLHLLPIPYSTPIPQMDKMQIYISKLPTNEKFILREIVKIISGNSQEFDVKKVTHLICKDTKNKKYELLKAAGAQFIALKKEWLINCLKTGTNFATDKYLIEQ